MSGTRTGLNYSAVTVRAEKMPVYAQLSPELQDQVLTGLQRMEMAAMRQWQSEVQ